MRDFADAFPLLQNARNLADYDPGVKFDPSNVAYLIDAAEVAMHAFNCIAPDEITDVLALMMVGARH